MGKIADVQEVTLTKLIPYQNNAKIHSKEQISKIADSINEFGFVNPVIIDKDYNVIAGHGRIMAAEMLNMDKVPCLFVEGLTDEQRRAYILADNKLAELAGWDFALLESEIDNIENIDMTAFGFEVEQTDFNMDDLFMESAPKEKEPVKIQCPHCGKWFEQ